METIDLTKDEKFAMKINAMGCYGSFGFESDETKKIREEFFKEAFLHYNKEKIDEINQKEN